MFVSITINKCITTFIFLRERGNFSKTNTNPHARLASECLNDLDAEQRL